MASIFDTLTSQWLKDRFLLGVDLTLDDGTDYPDGIYEQSIRAAVSYLEKELGIIIDPVAVETEVLDAYEPNRTGYWPFQLDRRPIWTLQKRRSQRRVGEGREKLILHECLCEVAGRDGDCGRWRCW